MSKAWDTIAIVGSETPDHNPGNDEVPAPLQDLLKDVEAVSSCGLRDASPSATVQVGVQDFRLPKNAAYTMIPAATAAAAGRDWVGRSRTARRAVTGLAAAPAA